MDSKNKDNNTLSVIVPLFNGEKYIAETIKMILESSYDNLEVIVVDDGSTDSGPIIVEKMKKKDTRICLFRKSNGGVVSSRNYGIEHSKGNYLAFVDQDDIVKPFMYEKLIRKIIEDNSDLAMCSSGRSVNGCESGYGMQENRVYEKKEIENELLLPLVLNGFDNKGRGGKYNQYPSIWTCVFRKEFFDMHNIRFRAYVNFEDDLLVKIEAFSKAHRISTISDLGYLWRVNLKSETYSHHYVDNIGEKQDLVFDDIMRSVNNCFFDKETNEYIKAAIYCKQYLDAIHNLTSPEIKKNTRLIKEYFKKNIYSREFDKSIQIVEYVNKRIIKTRLLLVLLKNKLSLLCYWGEIMLDWLLLFSLHSHFLTRVERRIKGCKEEK